MTSSFTSAVSWWPGSWRSWRRGEEGEEGEEVVANNGKKVRYANHKIKVSSGQNDDQE